MTDIANRAQQEFWNGKAGEQWVSGHERLDAMLRPIGLAAIDAADPRPGEAVLDIGCGAGETLLQLAGRIAPGGGVTGIDISAPLLAFAAARTANASAPVTLIQGDVQVHPLPAARFDLLFSRFGVMFFADPAAPSATCAAA